MYYTYMIRCNDGSLYTGMTNNVDNRFKEHAQGCGAKYTRSRGAQCVEAVWGCSSKSLACKLEYQIKRLTKKEKEGLVKGERLSVYLKGKVDCRRYRMVV